MVSPQRVASASLLLFVVRQVIAATFRVVLGCLAPRNSCDPTIGGSLQSGYIPAIAGTSQFVEYFVPLGGADQVDVQVNRAITADEGTAAGNATLDDVLR